MSKELDKVNEIQHTKAIYKADGTTVIESRWFNLLVAYAKEALQRLESIDNANPSEALRELDEIIEYITEDKKVKYKATILFDCEIIKQALLKAQEPKKYLKWNDLEFKEEEQKCKAYLEEHPDLWNN